MQTSTPLRPQTQVCIKSLPIQHVFRYTHDEHRTAGNIHGMPLSFLCSLADSSACKLSSSEPTPFAWLDTVHLDPSKLAYIGLRDIDAGEKAILRKHNIASFSMHEVDRYGIGQVVEMAIDRVNPGRDKPIHLSFDVDALDPSVAPSTGTPVRGGLTFREGHYICERLFDSGLLVAVDLMVSVQPLCSLLSFLTLATAANRRSTRPSKTLRTCKRRSLWAVPSSVLLLVSLCFTFVVTSLLIISCRRNPSVMWSDMSSLSVSTK